MRLGAIVLVKDEAHCIEEWVIFHALQGVDKFYVYDNDSIDNIEEVLSKWRGTYDITYVKWPGRCQQITAYKDVLQRAKTDGVTWLAVLDIDEFLWSPDELDIVTPDIVIEKLSFYNKKAGVIAVNWWVYGSNGHETRDDSQLVIERFTKKALAPDKHCKSIVNVALATGPGNDTHTFKTKGYVIDEAQRKYIGEYALTIKTECKQLCINHYHTKSKEEYRHKCDRGRSDIIAGRVYDVDFPAHDLNDVEDTRVRDRFAEHIKRIKANS